VSRLAAAFAVLLVSCTTASAPAAHPRPSRPPAPNIEWARGAVFYEIFPRSFFDTNGDGIGDLRGLTAKLDYVQDLGADAIWLTPIFESPSYHGYDATDYEAIGHDYGTLADFRAFVDAAHQRGIRVVLDFVMNHTSSQHPWFVASASSTTSSKRDWYVWSATDPGWRQPWGGDPSWHLLKGSYYYGVFWSGMPDLNWRNAAVRSEMYRLARFWLAQGADGFRLDATRYLIETGPGAGQSDTAETHAALQEFATVVRTAKSDAVLVAENTTDVANLAKYYADVPMNFNFPLAEAVLASVKSGDATRIVTTIREEQAAYPPGIIDAPFLTNHDGTRLATQLGDNPGEMRVAASILLTLPGAPFVYYGEEVGLQNGPTSADESKRTPMPWTATGGFTTGTPWFGYAGGIATDNVASQTNDPQSLLTYYRHWIAARKASPALLRGDLMLIDAPPQLLAFTRTFGNDRVLVVHNLGATPATYTFSGMTVTLSAHASGVWKY
jgi:glycosidase